LIPEKPISGAKKSSLIIADLQSHSLGGHFGIWLHRTIGEGVKRFDQVVVYVADEASLPNLFSLGIKDQKKVFVYKIPEIYRSKRFCGNILGVITSHHVAEFPELLTPAFFLMWVQQYLERDLIFPPLKSRWPWKKQAVFDLPWGSLTSVSSVAHEAISIPTMEKRLHEEVCTNSQCEAVFLWDEYSVRKLKGKYLALPDVEPLVSDLGWVMPEKNNVTLGTVGELWGYRSMNLMAEILHSEQGIKGYAGGVFKPDSYSLDAVALMGQENTRFSMEEGFVESDGELSQRLRKLDAFLLDARSYKCPSGLGIRAMAMGRPIVTMESPSWIASLVREEGVGVFWKQGEGILAEDLRRWYLSGGSERSLQIAHRLSDQSALERAYTEMFTRLKQRTSAMTR
jgi:glycosyltransferase involved in cell wall biosynthesis